MLSVRWEIVKSPPLSGPLALPGSSSSILLDQKLGTDLPPFIVPHSELDLLNRSPVEWPQVQAVDNPMHCEV